MSPEAIFKFCFSARLPARSIRFKPPGSGCERLLHEHVHAFVDGIVEMNSSKAGMGCQHGHITRSETIDRHAVSIESDELPLGGDVDLVTEAIGQGFVRRLQAIFQNIGHGYQLDGAAQDLARPESIAHSPRSTAPATDQCQSDRVVFGSVHLGNGHTGENRGGRCRATDLQYVATAHPSDLFRFRLTLLCHCQILLASKLCAETGPRWRWPDYSRAGSENHHRPRPGAEIPVSGWIRG